LTRVGQRDAAQDAFNKAVQLDPHYVIAQDNLALFYVAQNPPQAQLSRWHYQRAREAGGPRNPDLEKWLNQNGAPVAFLSGPGN
jgi:Tfp pilus assembly protein PilF